MHPTRLFQARFPPSVGSLVNHYLLVPAQLVPNSIASTTTFILFLQEESILWNLNLVWRVFTVKGDHNENSPILGDLDEGPWLGELGWRAGEQDPVLAEKAPLH